ncbi:MAG: chromophore lyase CpcT/CpeT [Pyrinomonadaceae bacterium MAG19_C2-C3]|nr:chromophore lyase CpcT/CpeT [Pyrinomonadaceae bacterium MAG19_C2-C3]
MQIDNIEAFSDEAEVVEAETDSREVVAEDGGDTEVASASSPVEVPTDFSGAIVPSSVTMAVKVQPHPATVAATVAPTNASDPVEAEPYTWGRCTIGISIQLLPNPDGGETYKEAYIGIRTHNDIPIIKRVAADELMRLPGCIMRLIDEMREEFPAREEHRAERQRREKEKKNLRGKSAAQSKSKNLQPKLKPGRYMAAAGKASGADAATVEDVPFDDIFRTAPEQQEAAGESGNKDDEDMWDMETASPATAKPTIAPNAKQAKKESEAGTTQNQMSLL